MKRRMSTSTAEADQDAPRRRRQPQISCDFCRSKKLKCDRAQPCSNCTSRGIPCEGQSLPPRSPGPGTNAASLDVLDRLRRLEEAVFGPAQRAAATGAVLTQPWVSTTPDEKNISRPGRIQREYSAELDYNDGTEASVLDDRDIFSFRIAGRDEYLNRRQTSARCIVLPTREDTLALYEDFLEHTTSHIVNTLHTPSVLTMVHDLYTRLDRGEKVDFGSAALIFSFSASSAFFWDKDFPSAFDLVSDDTATAQSRAWRVAALDLLDQCQRAAMKSFDAIQARLVLADLVYHMEGTSSRFRYIHSGARAAAYELGLHLVDLPGSASDDSEFLREMKRRVWWYLATTDWLVSASGGAIDRVYTVNPKHMWVNHPKHMPGSDQLIPMYGPWAEMAMLHMTMRIRLGEVCREIADALPIGSGGIETLSYSKVAALDGLFEQLLIDLPIIFSNKDEINSGDDIVRRIALQRSLGKLSLHARRARLLRPLLRANNLASQFEVLRKKCLDSTELVMDIASVVLSEAVDPSGSTSSLLTQTPRRSPYRSGLVINHLFMACAVVATDPALRGGGTEGRPCPDAGTERRRAALANACRLLEKTGEKSVMASNMVQQLVSVLRRHCVHGIEAGGHRSLGAGTFAVTDKEPTQTAKPPVADEMQATTGPSPFIATQQQAVPSDWGYGMVDASGLGGIWNDFLGTSPTDDGWQQLFADLDSFAGAGVDY